MVGMDIRWPWHYIVVHAMDMFEHAKQYKRVGDRTGPMWQHLEALSLSPRAAIPLLPVKCWRGGQCVRLVCLCEHRHAGGCGLTDCPTRTTFGTNHRAAVFGVTLEDLALKTRINHQDNYMGPVDNLEQYLTSNGTTGGDFAKKPNKDPIRIFYYLSFLGGGEGGCPKERGCGGPNVASPAATDNRGEWGVQEYWEQR